MPLNLCLQFQSFKGTRPLVGRGSHKGRNISATEAGLTCRPEDKLRVAAMTRICLQSELKLVSTSGLDPGNEKSLCCDFYVLKWIPPPLFQQRFHLQAVNVILVLFLLTRQLLLQRL